MPSIASQLETLASIKSDIKAAIIDKGQTVGDDFSTYATAIGNIECGGGGETTVIKQDAVTGGAFIPYNPSDYGEDEDTTEIMDELFSKIDISALATDFNNNVVSVSQAVAAAIGFSYNSTDGIIYYDFNQTNDEKSGFKFVENSGNIYLKIVIDSTETNDSIQFSSGYKYLIYNSDGAGSVVVAFADVDGLPQLWSTMDCLFASPYTYTPKDQTTIIKKEGFVYPYYTTGYMPYQSFSPYVYSLDGETPYPDYPTGGYGDPIICFVPYGWADTTTNPVAAYFTNIYLITRLGYESGPFIINVEGTYYLMYVSEEGMGGGIAFRLSKPESSLIGRVATGTFTTGSVAQQRVEINCGFQPDIVIVDLLFSNQHTTCMCYAPHSSSVWDVRPAESVVHPVPMNTNGETGISEITSTGFNFRVNGNNTFNLPCEYAAIKL